MRHASFLLALLLSSMLYGTVTADPTEAAPDRTPLDWPQWRGIHRDAVSAETGLLTRWPEEGPKVVWRSGAGAGYSSVSISEGKAYTLWDEKNAQFLVCLDATSGRELWRHELGPGFKHHYGDGPRSTPLIDGDVAFAIGTSGRLVAVDKNTGETRWQHDFVREFETTLPSYGYSSSPLIVGEKLVVEAGGKDAAYVAFEKNSGSVAWVAESDRPAYSSPIEVTIDGTNQVVFWSASGLHAVSSDSGKVLWRYSWETYCPVTGDPLNTGTPLFLPPDRIFISSGSGATVLRITREEQKFEIEIVWESEQMRADVNTPLVLGNYIYGFDRGILKCLDARTGEVRWKARGFERGSLIAADGKLIVLGERGNLALVEATPEGFTEIGSAQILSGKNWTAPSLAGGRLYLRNHEELICLDVKG